MARVAVEKLTKIFKGPRGESIRAVSGLNLVVEDKEFLVLAGPSGCGKTTTLRLIAGLDEPDTGTVSIDGQIVNDQEPGRRDIAMVFQNFALYPHLTVYENLAFGLKLRKIRQPEINERVQSAAKLLGLSGCLERKPEELSGGERQRVAVGRAIVRQPKVFLFDEPLSNLDAPLRAQMRREIAGLHRRLAATMIYVTHDQVEAMTLGDRIAIMKAGVIQQVAAPMTIYRQPANRFVAGFIGFPPMNFIHGALVRRNESLFFQEQASDGLAGRMILAIPEAAAIRVSGHAGRKTIIGIRPENVSLAKGTGVSAAGGVVEAVVETAEAMGAETHLHATTGTHSIVARLGGETDRLPQTNVSLVFEMTRAHFFDPESGQALA